MRFYLDRQFLKQPVCIRNEAFDGVITEPLGFNPILLVSAFWRFVAQLESIRNFQPPFLNKARGQLSHLGSKYQFSIVQYLLRLVGLIIYHGAATCEVWFCASIRPFLTEVVESPVSMFSDRVVLNDSQSMGGICEGLRVPRRSGHIADKLRTFSGPAGSVRCCSKLIPPGPPR